MRVEPELAADADGPVTTTVTRRVKPGHEAAYEAFLAGISHPLRRYALGLANEPLYLAAVVGVVGVTIASHRLKASSKSLLIRVRTRCALR